MLYFVEFLTLRTWVLGVLPKLLRNRAASSCYFIDSTGAGKFAARVSLRMLRSVSLERLEFRLADVHDEAGLLVRLQIPYFDLRQVQADAASESEFRLFCERAGTDRLKTFVFKTLVAATLTDRHALWRTLFVIRVCAWKKRQFMPQEASLFLESRAWFTTVQRYAEKYGIRAIGVFRSFSFGRLPYQLLSPRTHWRLRAIRNRLFALRFGLGTKPSKTAPRTGKAVLATEYSGYFNVNRPECYSDLFFWQQSTLSGEALLLTFSLPGDPVSEERVVELAQHGIRAIALNAGSTTTPSLPLFSFSPGPAPASAWMPGAGRTRENRWIQSQVEEYWSARNYWSELFRRENVKLFATWYRYDGLHCAIGDAIRSVGGIMAVYQRASQLDAGPEITIDTDIAFGYAPLDADVDQRSGSIVRYHVAVGYFGDHRFPLLRQPAAELRERLKRGGAEFVIAFFDENSGPDPRWHTGHKFQQHNYAFVLEKVLSDPSLGLILKPKVPSTLRKRLGNVAELLERSLATGRCFLYEEGRIQGSFPPAVAAMAADVAIHGHLSASTAGLEAALAGTPTLLLDREGWQVSEMYELGEGRVVFRSWDELWRGVEQYRIGKSGSWFGDWSPMLDRLDPFRDGKGAERMGTYMSWLLDGLNRGLDREVVMADAAERYRKQWGDDKVREIRGGESGAGDQSGSDCTVEHA